MSYIVAYSDSPKEKERYTIEFDKKECYVGSTVSITDTGAQIVTPVRVVTFERLFWRWFMFNGFNFEKSKEGEKLKDNWFRTWKPLIADYMTKKKLMIVVDNKPGHYDWDKVAPENVKIVFTLCPIKKKEVGEGTFSDAYHKYRFRYFQGKKEGLDYEAKCEDEISQETFDKFWEIGITNMKNKLKEDNKKIDE